MKNNLLFYSLHLEGKKLPLHATNRLKGNTENTGDNKVSNYFEEVIAGEEFEEYLAVHKR